MLSIAILDLFVSVFLICFIAGSILSILQRIIPHKGGPCQYVESFQGLMWGKTAVHSQEADDSHATTVPARVNNENEPQKDTANPSTPIQPVHTVTEQKYCFVLSVEVPGYKADELILSVTDVIRQVVLSGKNATRQPIRLAATFPPLTGFKNLIAVLEDGILKVTVEKIKRDRRIVQVLTPKKGASGSG
ncbi:hypothetical protein HDU81_010323 [Chytriomyces hyalinus]|nr:hypothetical protein HDU81_010323 [Chytriomyces hyalinus]